ncbi:MAG: hypothetical protein GF344_01360 [Chitinivibrionales bacterium]|nr:hypothetical protein [Chitinivibrionales bacterium]MBD3355743.1 hypothetical protein [Chitinivibrionales bacterium]
MNAGFFFRHASSARAYATSSIAVLVILAACTNDYNPFADSSNAKALITAADFPVGDSIDIFTTYNLSVGAAVAELIDSFVISASNNRYWTHGDTSVVSPAHGDGRYSFKVSFVDTGWQNITIKTFRTGGDFSSTVERVYTRSPLHQDTVVKALGDVCDLSTPGVGDRDVLYRWQFGTILGKPQLFTSTLPRSEVVPKPYDEHKGALEYQKGLLWVCDSALRHFSPPAEFFFGFYDEVGPYIVCLNDSLRGDTIITGDSIFLFRVRLEDPAGIGKQGEIDGGAFDYSKRYSLTSRICGHIFRRLERYSSDAPRRVVVNAWDGNGTFSADTFFLAFAPDGPRSEGASITMLNPSDSLTFTSQKSFRLACRVINRTGGTLLARAKFNGLTLPHMHAFSISEDTMSWPLALTNDSNFVTIEVVDSTGDRKALQDLTIIYDEDAIDEKPPFVDLIMVGENAVFDDEMIVVSTGNVLIGVLAYDGGSGIASVRINEHSAQKTENEGWWKKSVLLTDRYNSLSVTVTDYAGNCTTNTVSVVHNSFPQIIGDWKWPGRFRIGNVYKDTIRFWDEDNDSVICSMSDNAPSTMSLVPIGGNKWQLTCQPSIADINTKSATVTITDGYRDSVFLWRFEITNQEVKPLRLLTTASDFPSQLQVLQTLSVELKVAPGTGQPPVTFFARTLGTKSKVIHDSVDEDLSWHFTAEDTGKYHLMVSAFDVIGGADTIYTDLFVLPRNENPCTLMYNFSGSKRGGVLDMRGAHQNETIHFRIKDEDHPLTEQYRVTLEGRGRNTLLVLDTTNYFEISLKPDAFTGRDTIRVTVWDRSGTQDRKTLYVDYGVDSVVQVADLSMRLDADAGVALDEGGVLSWGDQSENGLFLECGHSDKRPDYQENAINGYPVLSFDGNNDHLASEERAGDEWIEGPFTVFCVARLDEVEEGRRYTLLSSGADHGPDLGVTCSGKVGAFEEESHTRCYGGDRTQSSNLSVRPNQWYIFVYRSKKGINNEELTVDVRLSGNAANSPLTLRGMPAEDDMILGAGEMGDWTGAWKGDIAEFIWYGRALEDNEIWDIEDLLAKKFDLELGL